MASEETAKHRTLDGPGGPSADRPLAQLDKVPLSDQLDAEPALLDNTIESGLIWHYTNAAGLIGILEHSCLWATSTVSLNDSLELLHGTQMMDEARTLMYGTSDEQTLPLPERNELDERLVDYRKRLASTGMYVLCASTESDLLSNWRAYANFDGYAIGLNCGLLGILTEKKAIPIYDSVNQNPVWHAVHYNKPAQLKACGAFLRAMLWWMRSGRIDDWLSANSLYEEYATTVACMKHSTFRDEREARYFVSAQDFPPAPKVIYHRPGRYGVTPYLKLTPIPVASTAINRRNGHVVSSLAEASLLPIDHIVVGPTTDPTVKIAGLVSLLASTGYADVPVNHSLSPAKS